MTWSRHLWLQAQLRTETGQCQAFQSGKEHGHCQRGLICLQTPCDSTVAQNMVAGIEASMTPLTELVLNVPPFGSPPAGPGSSHPPPSSHGRPHGAFLPQPTPSVCFPTLSSPMNPRPHPNVSMAKSSPCHCAQAWVHPSPASCLSPALLEVTLHSQNSMSDR